MQVCRALTGRLRGRPRGRPAGRGGPGGIIGSCRRSPKEVLCTGRICTGSLTRLRRLCCRLLSCSSAKGRSRKVLRKVVFKDLLCSEKVKGSTLHLSRKWTNSKEPHSRTHHEVFVHVVAQVDVMSDSVVADAELWLLELALSFAAVVG